MSTFGYDYENRLTAVSSTAGYTAAYTYNADGLRLRAQESKHAYPDRWFQYDGVRPVLEGTLSGDTWTTLNRYIWEGDSYYSPLAWASIGGNNRYYLYDGLGSTRQLVNADQTTTDTYSYEAFGNLMSSTGSTVNPYRYVGELGYYATGSSLMHLGFRHYMPEIGRFMARDPADSPEHSIVAWATSRMRLPLARMANVAKRPLLPARARPVASPYVYCTDNPANCEDPNGLLSRKWCVRICIGSCSVGLGTLCATICGGCGPGYALCYALCIASAAAACADWCDDICKRD